MQRHHVRHFAPDIVSIHAPRFREAMPEALEVADGG